MLLLLDLEDVLNTGRSAAEATARAAAARAAPFDAFRFASYADWVISESTDRYENGRCLHCRWRSQVPRTPESTPESDFLAPDPDPYLDVWTPGDWESDD